MYVHLLPSPEYPFKQLHTAYKAKPENMHTGKDVWVFPARLYLIYFFSTLFHSDMVYNLLS